MPLLSPLLALTPFTRRACLGVGLFALRPLLSTVAAAPAESTCTGGKETCTPKGTEARLPVHRDPSSLLEAFQLGRLVERFVLCEEGAGDKEACAAAPREAGALLKASAPLTAEQFADLERRVLIVNGNREPVDKFLEMTKAHVLVKRLGITKATIFAFLAPMFGVVGLAWLVSVIAKHVKEILAGPKLLIVPANNGRMAPRRNDPEYAWLRRANEEADREQRRKAAHLTFKASELGGYIRNDGETVHLPYVGESVRHTRLERAPGHGEAAPGGADEDASLEGHLPGSVFPVAMDLARKGRKVVAVNAASAYHAGGGVTTGGRHALEEAMCMQSTLYKSLEAAEVKAKLAKVRPPAHVQQDRSCHIPEDGVIVSPQVEVFRGPTNEGYPFLQKPVTLHAVVSVAMPNCNDQVRDSPVDRPESDADYHDVLKKKFAAIFHAAAMEGADTIVIPDAGCGVFRNKPEDVGWALGVVGKKFRRSFAEIHLCGSNSFIEAASQAFSAPPGTGFLQEANGSQGNNLNQGSTATTGRDPADPAVAEPLLGQAEGAPAAEQQGPGEEARSPGGSAGEAPPSAGEESGADKPGAAAAGDAALPAGPPPPTTSMPAT